MFRKFFLIVVGILLVANFSFANELLEMKELKEKVRETSEYFESIDWHVNRKIYLDVLPKEKIMYLILVVETSDIKESSEVERVLERDYEGLYGSFLGMAHALDEKGWKHNRDYEGSYLFVDLDNDGVCELIYTTNNGRGIFTPGVIYWQDGKLKHYNNFVGMGLLLDRLRPDEEYTKGPIQDLNNDGKWEFLFYEAIGEVRGLATTTFWTAIYNWDGKKFVRVDEKFPKFYQNIIIKTGGEIEEFNKTLQEDKSLLPNEKEDIKRRLAGAHLILKKAQEIVEKK